MAQAGRVMRNWSERLSRVAQQPVSKRSAEAICSLLERSALQRMDDAVSPEGVPHKPLSAGYAKWKRHTRGQTRIWQLTGASKRSLRVFQHDPNTLRLIINTPYSKVVHDGGTWTVHAPTSSSLATRNKVTRAMRRRTHRFNKRLVQEYGTHGLGRIRRDDITLARQAKSLVDRQRSAELRANRRQGKYLLGSNQRANMRFGRQGAKALRAGLASAWNRTSWSITLPARPVLGMSQDDAALMARVVMEDLRRELGGA